jgi:hypothetical protein
MVNVTVRGTLTDTRSGIDPASARYAVADEYGRVEPAGPIAVAANGSYVFTIALEAARDGGDMDGRRYVVTVSGQDRAGNLTSQSAAVVVPHDASSR